MGTLLYMAPERFREGFSSSVASDVFSLGMMYFELLVGNLPFRQDMHPVQSLIAGHYLKDMQGLMKAHSVPKPVSNLIIRMVAHNPRERFANYTELRKELIKAWKNSNSFLGKLLN